MLYLRSNTPPSYPRDTLPRCPSETRIPEWTGRERSLYPARMGVLETLRGHAENQDILNTAPDDDIGAIFRDADAEIFHDGMDSDFSRRLRDAIARHGDAAITALEACLLAPGSNIEASEEALRLLGDIEDTRTHGARLALLLRALESPDPRLRDAASIGLATLDDPAAIDGLRRAIEAERSGWLRTNLDLTLSQLLEHPRSA